MANRMDVRDGMKRVFREKCINQAALARRVGLTEQQLSDIVRKRRKLDANEMFDICDAIDITPADLFADTGQQ